jgi:hypothetical protein
LNIVVCINAGIDVIAIAVYCASTRAIAVTGAGIVGVNRASAVTGAVSIY